MELLEGKKSGGVLFALIRLAALGLIISAAFQGCRCEVEPTESQCRPYIEKALKEQQIGETEKTDDDWTMLTEHSNKEENVPTDELAETIEASVMEENEGLHKDDAPGVEEFQGDENSEAKEDGIEEQTEEDETKGEIESAEKQEGDNEVNEDEAEFDEQEEGDASEVEGASEEREKEDEEAGEENAADGDNEQRESAEMENNLEDEDDRKTGTSASAEVESREFDKKHEVEEWEKDATAAEEDGESSLSRDSEGQTEPIRDEGDSKDGESTDDDISSETGQTGQSKEDENDVQELKEVAEEILDKKMQEMVDTESESSEKAEGDERQTALEGGEEELEMNRNMEEKETAEADIPHDGTQTAEEDEEQDLTPEEDLTKEAIIPENLRTRDHVTQILRLDEDSVETESILEKASDSTLKSLKGLYDSAIKPLEMLYKYRDLSNRHFGDPEIFSKPLILFMGPWSGGKSTTINYLLDNEFKQMSLRTGAEPSPAYFNIMMYGNEEEVLDGTQLAADWTFSGLQKFGQSLLDRLKGYKLPNRLLEKVNIVEIPGILEIRKQVQRLFPFNDACQWFIDRADIIFLVYDPSKLDVGPETEAILDQLKGREYQTRIILNKADQVKPEELMRVQGTLIWNISPLMSSTEPPVMYTTSLWSLPYESGAPTRLLSAQEKAFLRDLRDAIDKRVENKIASARRFAVRVRNHAKMVDCYLTTYYNHKTFFGNKKKISDDIIENPQKYHIYEGLSTLTNISRYDLPDPDVYRDFFKLNSLYDFKKLSDTCTYFRGCPINTLDVAIAYDLPELVGKYKKAVEAYRGQTSQKSNS